MKLLFKRDQGRSTFNRPIFKLFAKVDLDDEEKALVSRYRMNDNILIKVEQPKLFSHAVLLGFLVFVIAIPIIAFNFYRAIGLGWTGVFCVSAIVALICGFVFYHQNRETIYLKDVIYGRYFSCHSVVELAQKEAWIEGITTTLRQVLEAAKHWGDTETRDIPVLSKEDALALIKRL